MNAGCYFYSSSNPPSFYTEIISEYSVINIYTSNVCIQVLTVQNSYIRRKCSESVIIYSDYSLSPSRHIVIL